MHKIQLLVEMALAKLCTYKCQVSHMQYTRSPGANAVDVFSVLCSFGFSPFQSPWSQSELDPLLLVTKICGFLRLQCSTLNLYEISTYVFACILLFLRLLTDDAEFCFFFFSTSTLYRVTIMIDMLIKYIKQLPFRYFLNTMVTLQNSDVKKS